MLDRAIRKALYEDLMSNRPAPDTTFIDELGLCEASARVDIAVVDSSLRGYEIKSDGDTLQRLPNQIDVYSRVFDYVTVVAGGRHVHKVLDLVPAWWGLLEACEDGNAVRFTPVRDGLPNTSVDAFSLAQLLWRDEALDQLKAMGIARGVLSKPREDVMKRLAASCTVEEVGRFVRRQLKARSKWRVPSETDASLLLRSRERITR